MTFLVFVRLSLVDEDGTAKLSILATPASEGLVQSSNHAFCFPQFFFSKNFYLFSAALPFYILRGYAKNSRAQKKPSSQKG